MIPGKLPGSAGVSYNLDDSRQGPTALAVGAVGLFGHFYSHLSCRLGLRDVY